jgi:hypothetical protein
VCEDLEGRQDNHKFGSLLENYVRLDNGDQIFETLFNLGSLCNLFQVLQTTPILEHLHFQIGVVHTNLLPTSTLILTQKMCMDVHHINLIVSIVDLYVEDVQESILGLSL